MSRCCLEVVGISKHLVWCHFFGKCQIKVEAMKCIMQPLYNFQKIQNLCIAITIKLFLSMSNVVWRLQEFQNIQFSVVFLENVKIYLEAMKFIMQPLYNFLKIQNLCIAITINLFLPRSRCCLEGVGISKHLVWCRIFGKCQNLDGSNEMYYAATIQFSKNVQFVHCNYHQFIFANEQMMFGGCRNFKTSCLVLYFWKIQVETMKCIMQPLYNFLKMCNLCIAITINLFLPMRR